MPDVDKSANGFTLEASPPTTGESGWWSEVVNNQSSTFLNGQHASVLSFEYITLKNNKFELSTFDQAYVLASIIKHLNIPSLLSVIGCSYGGMVAQAFASTYPHLTHSLISLVSAHKNSIRSQTLRLIQRQILQLEAKNPIKQIALARALAVLTYRGVDEFDQRFGDLTEVESYLEHNGMAFAKKFSANRYQQLSASIDKHEIDPCTIKVPTLLIAIDSDQLVPVSLVKTFAAEIPAPCSCHIIPSVFGHDGFLKELHTITPILNDFLANRLVGIFPEQQNDSTRPMFTNTSHSTSAGAPPQITTPKITNARC